MSNFYIIAGPNGAGKTTAAYTFLPNLLPVKQFVNADEIARGISPFDPASVSIQAGKVMLHRIDQLLLSKESFAIETTLTTLSYLNTISLAKSEGYRVTLLFVWLNSVEIAIRRVQERVAEGGHDIPSEVIIRRYDKGIANLKRFLDVVNDWYIYDNSGSYYELIAKRVDDLDTFINFEKYKKILPHG